jgi:lipopolysaccharide transport system permease protein
VEKPVILIRSPKGWSKLGLMEVWHSRELLLFLAWRDIKVRYKQTALGALWAILQPFLMMVIFSIVFGRLAKIPSDDIPYPVFAYCALLPWLFFSTGVTQSANSLVASQSLLTKVYIPRLIIPMSAILPGLVDFALAFVVLIGLMIYYGIAPSLAVVTLPLFMLLAIVTAQGIGFWLSALNLEYRDIRYTLPFLMQIWLFATPVAYPSSLLGEPWRTICGINPMVGVVEGFRWALLGVENPPTAAIGISVGVALILLISGLYYFKRKERDFADRI